MVERRVADSVDRLPRGRHGLSRDEVRSSQRRRMLSALADAMMDKGYVGTSVADVIARAGVSRETFYQQFTSKADCFMSAFDAAGEALLDTVEHDALDRVGGLEPSDGDSRSTRLARFDAAFAAYLAALAANPAHARLFLVEVYAAGPEAIRTRAALQRRIVDALVALLDITSDHGRFACETLVAAVGAMVTEPLVTNRPQALHDLHQPVVDLVRRALEVDSAGG